jgi:Tfp pilus assembly protein PilO
LAENAREKTAIRDLNKARGVKLFLIFLLVVSVIVEGYYIYLLQDKIEKRNDELKNISVQLQFLKNEREDLKATLSSAKKTGEAGNGNTSER